jgi:hypothetical protein
MWHSSGHRLGPCSGCFTVFATAAAEQPAPQPKVVAPPAMSVVGSHSSAAFAAPRSSCKADTASSRRPTRVCCVTTGVPLYSCFESVSGLCLSSAPRDRGVRAATGPAPAGHARPTSSGQAPAAAAAAAATAPRIPRSLAEVDNGQILGFAAELSEVSSGAGGGADSRAGADVLCMHQPRNYYCNMPQRQRDACLAAMPCRRTTLALLTQPTSSGVSTSATWRAHTRCEWAGPPACLSATRCMHKSACNELDGGLITFS